MSIIYEELYHLISKFPLKISEHLRKYDPITFHFWIQKAVVKANLHLRENWFRRLYKLMPKTGKGSSFLHG